MASDAQLIELQQTLYSSRNPTRRWLHTTRRTLIIEAIQRAAQKSVNERALEVGFGSGVYCRCSLGCCIKKSRPATLRRDTIGSEAHVRKRIVISV